jgi:hypothetical protein
MLAATSCKLKWDNGNLSIEIEKGKTHVATLETAIARSAEQVAAHHAAMEARARKAEQDRDERTKALMADATRTDAELERLRSALSDYTGQRLAANPTAFAAGLDAADPIPELFIQCTSRYAEVARAADGHVNDIQTLMDAWPK